MGRERYTPQQQEFYRRYLQSPQWRKRKAARIAKSGARCEFVTTSYGPGGTTETRCSRQRYLCVHHSTYERLGAEYDSDLDVFCWSHHMLEHLLWKRCWRCGTVPCLENDEVADKWLAITLKTMGIDLDVGAVNWRNLPNKEVLLAQVPACCPTCAIQLGVTHVKP